MANTDDHIWQGFGWLTHSTRFCVVNHAPEGFCLAATSKHPSETDPGSKAASTRAASGMRFLGPGQHLQEAVCAQKRRMSTGLAETVDTSTVFFSASVIGVCGIVFESLPHATCSGYEFSVARHLTESSPKPFTKEHQATCLYNQAKHLKIQFQNQPTNPKFIEKLYTTTLNLWTPKSFQNTLSTQNTKKHY